jgi:hypothetical protein
MKEESSSLSRIELPANIELPAPSKDPSPASYTEPSNVNWERAFKALAAAYGSEMLSGDVHFLVMIKLQKHYKVEPEAVLEFLKYTGKNRSQFTRDFMG